MNRAFREKENASTKYDYYFSASFRCGKVFSFDTIESTTV